MNIKYVIPTYHRYDGLVTPRYIKKATVYCCESDYDIYVEKNPDIKTMFKKMPDEYQGKGKAIAMNWILDDAWDSQTDAVVMMDDDIDKIKLWRMEKEDIDLDEQDVYEVCENMTALAKEWGCGMFCFSLNGDRLLHMPFKPYRLHSTGAGQMLGFVKNDGIRFDERLFTSEDIDIQIQSIAKYHKLLKVDRYYLKVSQWLNSGGYQGIRNRKEDEKKNRGLLQKKWGKNIVRINKKQKEDVGQSIYIPLEGV